MVAEVTQTGDSTAKAAVKDGGQSTHAHQEVHNARKSGTVKTTDAHTSAQAQAHVDQVYGKIEIIDSSKEQGAGKSDGHTAGVATVSPDQSAKPTQAAQPQESWASSMLHRVQTTVNNVEQAGSNMVHNGETKVAQVAHNLENKVENVLHAAEHDAKATGQYLHNAGDVALQVVKGTGKEFKNTAVGAVDGLEKGAHWVHENPKKAAAIVGIVAAGVVAEVATGGTITPVLMGIAGSEIATGAGILYGVVKTQEAINAVEKHGDAAAIMNQQELNKTPEGRAQLEAARQQVQEDTGKAGMTVTSMSAGSMVKAVKAFGSAAGGAQAVETALEGAVKGVESVGAAVVGAIAKEAGPMADGAEKVAEVANQAARGALGLVKDLGASAYKVKGLGGNVSDILEKAFGPGILHPVHAADSKPQLSSDGTGPNLNGGYKIQLNPVDQAVAAR